MRFLRYVVVFLLLAVTLTVVGLLAWQEITLATGKQHLAQQLEDYTGTALPPQTFDYCKQLGTVSTAGRPLFTVQVRFIDSKQFVIEAVCDQYEFAPLELVQSALSAGVVKVPGSAGFAFGPGVWRVDLQADASFLPGPVREQALIKQLLSRTASVIVADGRLVADASLESSQPAEPITTCEGYGFTCCTPVAEQGEGESLPASDCSAACFARCQQLPQVFWLATSNGYDREQRTATVSRGELVTFSFVGDALDPATTTARLDFGDGNSWEGPMQIESVNHQYSCEISQCQYVASVTLTDQAGLPSVSTVNSRLTVFVR